MNKDRVNMTQYITQNRQFNNNNMNMGELFMGRKTKPKNWNLFN